MLESRERRAKEARVRAQAAGKTVEKSAAKKPAKPQPWHLVIWFFGAIVVISLGLTLVMLPPAQPTLAPEPSVDEGKTPPISMQLTGSAKQALSQPKLDESQVAAMQQEADLAMQQQEFEKAERILKEVLPHSRLRALCGFQIYVCLVLQGKTAEAEVLSTKFPPAAVAKNPAPFYVRAVKAIRAGRPEDGLLELNSARQGFPQIAPLYDQVLRKAGLMPAISTED